MELRNGIFVVVFGCVMASAATHSADLLTKSAIARELHGNNMLHRVMYADAQPQAGTQKLATQALDARSSDPITVQSRAFRANGVIPERYSDYGDGISPPLSLSGLPANTRAIVLVMEDPDAKSASPFVHWLAVLPPELTQIPEGVPPTRSPRELSGGQQGNNSRRGIGYFGPRPPAGDPPHRYYFQIFALDTTPDLPAGFDRRALLEAMQGHVLAKGTLIGTFARQR